MLGGWLEGSLFLWLRNVAFCGLGNRGFGGMLNRLGMCSTRRGRLWYVAGSGVMWFWLE